MGTYVSQESVIYCKPHFQQLFKTKGNFDESFGKEKQDKWKNQAVVTEKLSFVPATETDQQRASGDKNKTSEATAAKIRQWRQESESDLCSVCSKTVFNAEKLVVEEKNQKKIYHNSCFKCVQCGIKLDLRNYGTHEGKTYCKPHLKELTMANVKPTGTVVSNNLSFVPEVKEDKNVQKSETPAHIAAKFKGLGGAERCRQCDKTVYATEKLIVEELKQQHIYHKTCLRCSKCNIQLDASTYGSAQGVIYCKVHLKQVALPEPVKSENAYFVSPLHQNSDYSPQYTTSDSNDNYNNDVEGSNNNNNNSTSEELFEQQEQEQQRQQEQQNEEPVEQYTQEPEQERNQYSNYSNSNSNTSSPATSRKQSIINDSEAPGSPTTDDDRRKKREEREKQREEEEKRYQEERNNREREREEMRKQRESSSATDDENSDLERRRKEREERRRKADEEAKKEAEEQERRSEERRKRLEALKNQ